MQKPMIPMSLIRDLRCRHCQNFVSCGPVYVVPDESILCGRCQNLAKNIYQNTAYEALASMFMYPCFNWEDRCSMTLLWNESLQHEEECSYNGYCKFFWHHPRAYCKGRRVIPNGDIRLTPVPEHLLEHIKCILCECYLSCEPIYIQINGKNICHRCIHANGVPPNCLRNLAYEKLSTIIIFPCIYRNRGCPTRLKFGRTLWQHESECSYGQNYKKITKNPNQKEKGVITTHSGHYYGTITPNVVLFAPPSQKSEFDINKELMKSLKRQQERRIMRADEIGNQIEMMNSEDGSIITDDSEIKNSYSGSDGSSPTRLDDNDSRNRTSSYIYSPPPAEPGYFSNNKGKPPQTNNENYQQNLFIAQVHQENDPSPRISRKNSYNRQYSSSNSPMRKSSEDSLSPKHSLPRTPLNNIDSNMLAAHYPIFMYPRSSVSPRNYPNGVSKSPSFNRSFPQSPPYNGVPQTPSYNGVPQTPSYNSVPQTPSYNSVPQTPYNGMPPTPSYNGVPQTPSFNGGLQSPVFNGGFQQFAINGANRLSRTESLSSNKELMDELKIKLMKNNSTKTASAPDSPYKECNNLEEILQAHDRISK